MLPFAVALGVFFVVLYLGNIIMSQVNFSHLTAAIATLTASLDSVATAIRNPQVDNNSQGTVDELASRIEAISAGLTGLAAEETALDAAEQLESDPPAAEPIEPTGDVTTGDGSGEALPPLEGEEQPAAEGDEQPTT